jgi:hypothetical protein
MTDIASCDRSACSGKAPRSASSTCTVASDDRNAPMGRKEPHMMGAVSYAARATDERVTYLRIYADTNGETHMQDIDITLLPREVFKGHPPLRLSDTLAASGCSFCRVPSGMREVDWHNPQCRKLVIWLTGEVEFETSDGNIRRVAAGSIVLAEDTTGKGHISRHPPEGQLQVFVDLDALAAELKSRF